MALIDCPDCGTAVSDSAAQCAKCGCPIATQLVACPECRAKSFRSASSCPQCGCPLGQAGAGAAAPPPGAGPATGPAQTPIRVEQTVVHETATGKTAGEGVQGAAEIAQGMGAAMAMHKSFVGQSFGALLAYLLLWPLGFILNLIWLHEAKRIRQHTGISPSGSGCLVALLIFFFWIPLLTTLVGVALIAAGILAI